MFGIGECVFDGGADHIHECYQGVKLGVGTQENEGVINKTFPKVGQVEESQDYDAFFFSMNRSAQGGTILVPMVVPRIWCICVTMNLKVLCLRMKSSIMRTIWGGGQFVGSRCLYSSILVFILSIYHNNLEDCYYSLFIMAFYQNLADDSQTSLLILEVNELKAHSKV